MLDQLSPLDVGIEVPSMASFLNSTNSSSDSSEGGSSDDDEDSFEMTDLTVRLEGINETKAWALALLNMTSPVTLEGSFPLVEVSVENTSAVSALMASASVSEMPLTLPSLLTALTAVLEPSAVAMLADVQKLGKERPVDRSALLVELSGLTAGPLLSASSPDGMERLRLPMEWVLSPSMCEVLFEAESDDDSSSDETAEMAVTVDNMGMVAELFVAYIFGVYIVLNIFRALLTPKSTGVDKTPGKTLKQKASKVAPKGGSPPRRGAPGKRAMV